MSGGGRMIGRSWNHFENTLSRRQSDRKNWMTTRHALGLVALLLAGLGGGCSTMQSTTTGNSEGGIDRTVLPIAEPPQARYSELDARNAKAPARFEVKAPKG